MPTPSSHVPANAARVFRDERYGSVFETCSPSMSLLRQLGFALVEIDPFMESPAHFHKLTEEIYFITEGRGIMTNNGESFTVSVGDTICIPIGSVHKIRNLDSTPLRFVCSTSPPYSPDDDYEV